MGVDRTDYVMFAAKFPYKKIIKKEEDYNYYEKYEDNGYESEITEHNGLTMICDGMGGKYIFIGRVLAKSTEYEGLPITDCSLPIPKPDEILVIHEIHKQFNINFEDIDVKVWAFTHWH